MRVSYDPDLNADELAGAASRTPARSGVGPGLSASGLVPHGGLSASLGYAPPVAAAATLQPMAATYFRGSAAGGLLAGAQALSAPPPASTAARLPFVRTAVAASTAARQAPARVYEESIVTGDFRRVQGALGSVRIGVGLPFSSALGRQGGCCGGGGKDGSGELDGSDQESMYTGVGHVVQAGCKIAQGLLSGILLVLILQLSRLPNAADLVHFMGPILPPIRAMMHVLCVLAFIGSAELALETRTALGAWQSQYAVIADAASLRLSTSVRYTWTATGAYMLACITIFASMPTDAKLRTLGGLSDAELAANASVDGVVSSWKAAIIVRFALVLVGMLSGMAGSSTPTDVYRALKSAAEDEAELAQARATAGRRSSTATGGARPGEVTSA